MMNFFHIFSSKTKRRSRESSPEQNPLTSPLLYREKEHALRKFSFSELENATNNFNRSQWIRDGQLGRVYKGSIKPPGGQGAPLVVEITKLHNIHSMQGHEKWLAAVEFLGDVEHPNLVKLLGYCLVDNKKARQSQRLLVYEYMPNKSLEYHLFNRELPPIPWIKRLQILLGAAQGLAYLHEGLETQVILGNFNSADVLISTQNFRILGFRED
ncbi:hypothetical protein Lser_V15G30684 [Lactuca serriola]